MKNSDASAPSFLRTKLYPPRLPAIAERERLLEALKQARNTRLTTIVGGPGYGKSTLAVEFLENLGCPFVWYQLEKTDADLAVFLSYLIAGFQAMQADFGHKTRERMASTANLLEQNRGVLSTFLAELDTFVGEHVFIVLDDFQEVNYDPRVREAVEFLLDHMLPNLHLLILSRAELSLSLTRLRAGRQVLEIGENELSFTEEETATLFRQVLGVPMTDQDISILRSSTEGWVAGLVLFYLAMKKRGFEAVSEAVRELPVSTISDYLFHEVYENQEAPVRDFLKETSILSRMNPQFCSELLGSEISADLLEKLNQERLFVIPLDDAGTWYRYHGCLRTCLRQVLAEETRPEDIRTLHLRAAALWERAGELEEALHHYMSGADFEKGAEILEDIALDLMRQNRPYFVYQSIARVGEEILEDHPRLLLYLGQAAGILGDYDHSMAAVRRAATVFAHRGDRERQALAVMNLAEQHMAVGKQDEAAEMAFKAIGIMPEDSPWQAGVMAVESLVCEITGNIALADQLLDEAIRRARQVGGKVGASMKTWCGVSSFVQGRMNQALELLENAESLPVERVGIPTTHPFVYGLLSRTLAFLDRVSEAREVATRGVELGSRLNLRHMVFLSRAARAVALGYLGRHQAATEDATIAGAICEGYRDSAELLFAELFAHEAFALTGAGDIAKQHQERVAQLCHNAQYSPYLPRIAAIGATLLDAPSQVSPEEVAEIIEGLQAVGPRIGLSIAYAFLIEILNRADRTDEALAVLEEYHHVFGDDVLFRTYNANMGSLLPLLADAVARKVIPARLMRRAVVEEADVSGDVLRRLAESDDREAVNLAHTLVAGMSRSTAQPLIVCMLGSFEMQLGKRRLLFSDWSSKKSLVAFKYLALNRNKGFVPREVLMELLWPESSTEAAQRNLNMAISTLRRTLEPAMQRRQSSYLLSVKDSFQLNLGQGGWTDVEIFQQKTIEAREARELGDFDVCFVALREAIDLYRGPLLPEESRDDWCAEERKQLAAAYGQLLVDLSTELLRRDEFAEAISVLDKAIALDPANEQLCRKQMQLNAQTGNRVGVEEAFRRCRDYLRQNYDARPANATLQLYRKLRK